MKLYAGIGSRTIPLDVEILMYEIGQYLGKDGWTLRSGHAKGSDLAFENGCDEVNGKKEIFFPENVPEDVIEYSLKFHPAPKKLKDFGREAMGRNAQIILGENLKSPVKYVVGYCTYDAAGNWMGGTSNAFRIANHHNIQIFNLFHEEIRQKFIRKLV